MRKRYAMNSLGAQLGQLIGQAMWGNQAPTVSPEDASSIGLNNARANKANAEAYEIQQAQRNQQNSRMDFLQGETGLPMPQLGTAMQYMKSGQWGDEMAGPTPDGSAVMPEAPDFYTDQVAQALRQGMSVLGLNGVAGKSNPAQLGDLVMDLENRKNMRGALSGDVDPSRLGAVMAAMSGKAPYDQGTQGVVNTFTGEQQTTPKLGAEINALNALAGQRDSQARYYDERALSEADGGSGASGGKQSANIQWAEYLQNVMGLSQEETLAMFQNAKAKPQDVYRTILNGLVSIEKEKMSKDRRPFEELALQAKKLVDEMQRSGNGATINQGGNGAGSEEVAPPVVQPGSTDYSNLW